MVPFTQALLYLVERCPDINVQDGDGWTPLMYAAKSGAAAIVKYLIQRGADPNIRQVIGYLLGKIATVTGNRKQGSNTHELHRTNPRTSEMDHVPLSLPPFLVLRNMIPFSLVCGLVQCRYRETAVIWQLFKYSFLIGCLYSPQSVGFTALYLASQEDSGCICRVLLEAGADPNLCGGSQSLGPLHIAAHR